MNNPLQGAHSAGVPWNKIVQTFMQLEWTDIEHEVTSEESRLRLDIFLSRKYPVINREGWQERIHAGHVRLNGETVKPSRKLQPGDHIWIEYQKKKEPEVESHIEIIFRDRCLLIVNKPSNLPVHPSGIYHRNTLQHILTEKLTENSDEPYKVRPVHRLDRETSGLMLLAESQDCARELSRLMRHGGLEKEYLVIVEGQFPEGRTEDGWLEAAGWIGPDPESEVKKKQRFWQAPEGRNPAAEQFLATLKGRKDAPPADHLGRRACHTDFRCLRRTTQLSLLQCRLHTGRMHQIRATLHGMGYPVVGDRLYGFDPKQYLRFIHDVETAEQLSRLRMDRVALHSHILRFIHPQSKEALEFVCDLPLDMKIVMDQ
ncbi:MAG: RluA family pseudouridine synthase [Leptospiraceae bacterium]|nr:RluA family pseudouridine synthase [Leptospiraceae bacterium]